MFVQENRLRKKLKGQKVLFITLKGKASFSQENLCQMFGWKIKIRPKKKKKKAVIALIILDISNFLAYQKAPVLMAENDNVVRTATYTSSVHIRLVCHEQNMKKVPKLCV